ncbi:Fur family transcriptional regulator [Noviherbaspirillum denitrificans]|uniref:Transcriptional regulator n=1 Tax=Noviherbaspirillum denitrificans TaxID=1968433 RepID=A0A254T8G8_9BURK|nr:Fur family transcriptional regulator [Noviherbaspirillum denitrificans]OWW18875.1 transcriptional regulator [Noviherbaspirillum denitrificans]
MSSKARPEAPANPKQSDSTTRAEAQLRGASVRITDARVKVLAALLDAERAFSHQDVQEAFADMDRVTLYRALDCLTDAGLAHKIAGDDRVFRYSAGAEHGSEPHHQHGHFKCTRCSRVFCLDSIAEAETLQNALQQSLGKGFRSHDIEFTIKGWCADCAS